jgi:predicted transcriptional regulator
METMHNDIRRLERENLLKEEKNRFIVQENQLENNKTAKYKKIAKTLKAQIEQIESTVSNLKKIGQEETKTLH